MAMAMRLCAAAAALCAATVSAADLQVRTVERFRVDGAVDDYCYRSDVWTDPFVVFDRENPQINGLMEKVGKPFCDLKTTAAAFADATNLYVAVSAPNDLKFAAGNGDGVGVALSPDGQSMLVAECGVDRRCKVYRVAADGTRRALDGSGVKAAVSKGKWSFSVEFAIPYSAIGRSPAKNGEAWRANFYRTGPSCGGISSWSPVQYDMFNPDRFGRLLFGEQKFGEDAILPENRGKAVFLWEGYRWGDNTADIKISGGEGSDVPLPLSERELERIAMWGPRGGRAMAAFRVSNRTDRPALYSLKADDFGKNAFARLVRCREVAHLELRGGPTVPDPIFDLPNGSVLRIPAKSTAVVWLDVDTCEMPAGVHRATLRLVPGCSGFEEKTVALELTVGRADVREVDMPTWTYGLGRWPKDIRLGREYRINTFCMLAPQYAPKPGKDGTRDWTKFDEAVEAMKANGIRPEEMYMRFGHLFPRWLNPRDNPQVEQSFIEGVRAGIAHAREKYGIGVERIWLSTVDEPSGDPDDPKTPAAFAIYGARLAKRIDPGLKSWTNPWKSSETQYLSRYLETFDVLCPSLGHIVDGGAGVPGMYASSGREIWSYSVLLKQNRPMQYRRMSWRNMAYGFGGPAVFYDAVQMSGDGFNSYDEKGAPDYGTMFVDWRTGGFSTSMRMEAWYQGHLEQRLYKWCRVRIAALPKDGRSAAFAVRLDDFVKRASAPRADLDALSLELLRISDELAEMHLQ